MLATVGALAVGAGVWWAKADRPPSAALAALPDEPPSVVSFAGSSSTATPPATTPATPTAIPPATGGAPQSDASTAPTPPDWATVIGDLDRQRSAAFAAADPTLLQQVYATDAPGLIEDGGRIDRLQAAGLRVAGLTHQITSVELVEPTGSGAIVLVVDALPAGTILDAAGAVAATTSAVPRARRFVTVVAVDGGYRIASVAAAD